MAAFTNEFSWSRTRDRVFQECRRRYFYQYYGSWGGWEADASSDVRRLYVLKQLVSRDMWAGRVVHEAVELALGVFRDGRDVPVEPFIADTIARMRDEWRSSKAGHYRDVPKTTALWEHEYQADPGPDTWKALSQGVARCLRNFFRLPLLVAIRATPPAHWTIEHDSRSLLFEGTPVWAVPDFGFWEGDRLVLVDWKSGMGGGQADFQLGCYGLWASEVLEVPPERTGLREVGLRAGRVTAYPWDQARLEGVRERIRLSIRGMRSHLADPASNVATIDDFVQTEELRSCRTCNFRAVCRPEL